MKFMCSYKGQYREIEAKDRTAALSEFVSVKDGDPTSGIPMTEWRKVEIKEIKA